MMAVHASLVIIVLQKRRVVADVIAGRRDATGPLAVVRRRLARVWHIVAIFYLVALWLVWAFEVQDGFSRLIRVFVSAVVVITVGRLLAVAATGALDRALRIDPALAARYPGLEAARAPLSADRAQHRHRHHRRNCGGGSVPGLGTQQPRLVRGWRRWAGAWSPPWSPSA